MLALFPDHYFHLQSLIACSMQIWKACEIWSHEMMSVRQRVGNKESQALSRNVCPRTGARAFLQAASIPLIVCNAREGPMWNRNYYSWSQLPVCLPSSTCCCHTTKYPRPIPPYLHTASLQVGTKLHQFLSLFLLFTAAFCTTLLVVLNTVYARVP